MSSHHTGSHYAGNHYLSSHYGRLVPAFTPEPVHPPGTMGPVLRRRILEEDELLIAVIMAFLQIKDDRWH